MVALPVKRARTSGVMSWQGYRTSKIGESLVEALDRFISEGKLDPEQANIILSHFDEATAKFLATSSVKCQMKGDLHTYRSFDDVYTLIVKDCEIKISGTKREPRPAGSGGAAQQSTHATLKSDMIKLVCQDAKISHKRHA